jgi:hypothetical protein
MSYISLLFTVSLTKQGKLNISKRRNNCCFYNMDTVKQLSQEIISFIDETARWMCFRIKKKAINTKQHLTVKQWIVEKYNKINCKLVFLNNWKCYLCSLIKIAFKWFKWQLMWKAQSVVFIFINVIIVCLFLQIFQYVIYAISLYSKKLIIVHALVLWRHWQHK